MGQKRQQSSEVKEDQICSTGSRMMGHGCSYGKISLVLQTPLKLDEILTECYYLHVAEMTLQ